MSDEQTNDDTSTPTEFTQHIGHSTLTVKLCTCKCGRKLLAHLTAVMPRCRDIPTATCLQCTELDDAFRKQSPEIAGLIERWKTEYLEGNGE